MARFDLYEVRTWRIPLMVDVQSEQLGEIGSRVVVPLRSAITQNEPAISRLKPVLNIESLDFILVTTDIAAHPAHWLGRPVGNISEHRDAITAALDFLFQGY